tara:strand:+ start:249 stop:536 length:288 start_codon:yes stop_codon:yes gene_type:complete
LNEAKHVSRIIGLIDLGNASANALCELDSVTTLQKRAQANADDNGISSLPRSFSPENKVVVYEAHLTELMRHLERETHGFQRLYARAKTIEQART